jgi:hypothetical protein
MCKSVAGEMFHGHSEKARPTTICCGAYPAVFLLSHADNHDLESPIIKLNQNKNILT